MKTKTERARHSKRHIEKVGQHRLWLLDQFQPGSSFYNMLLVMQLDGPLDTHALERNLNAILRRHEILCITFFRSDTNLRRSSMPSFILRWHATPWTIRQPTEAHA